MEYTTQETETTEVEETVDTTDLGELADETLETTEVEAPEVETVETEAADPFAELGSDRATVEAALRLHNAAQTQDGVVQLFFEAAQALGVGVKDVQALLGMVDETTTDTEEEDLDRPVTIADLRRMEQEKQAATQRDQLTVQQTAARSTVQTLLAELKVTDQAEAKVILDMGDKYLKKGDLDPANIAAAVKRGHADYEALVDKRAQAYLEKKRAKAAVVPAAPSGAGGASEPPAAEPKNVSEAIEMARKKLREQGAI